MGLGDLYVQVAETLKSTLESITDFSEVNIGWKEQVDAFPSAFIIPRAVRIEATSPERSMYVFTFYIAVCVEKQDLVEGLKTTLNLLGKINDKLIEDRTLGGVIHCLEIRELSPAEKPSEYVRYWGGVEVECWIVRV